MNKSIQLAWLMMLGLAITVHADIIFNDTFIGANNATINTGLLDRQASGLVQGVQYYATSAGRAENEVKIKTRSGEPAMGMTVFTQSGADSWVAVRLGTNFYAHLAGKKYSVKMDAQFGVQSGSTANDFWLGLGILGRGEAAQVPTSANTDFGIRLNAAGGGYGIYSDGSSITNAAGSGLTFAERFTLTLNVDETGESPVVQVLLQGVGDLGATDLGTYNFNFDPGETDRAFSLRVNQTGTNVGVLYLDVFDMAIIPEPTTIGLFVISSAGLLLFRRMKQ